MKTKLRRIIYWLLSIVIFVGSPDVVFGESSELKVEEQQKKKNKKKKKKKKKVVKRKVVKKKKAVKTKVEKRAEKIKAARVQVPHTPAPPHFNNISKEDFVSGKHKRLTIPYVEGGALKYGVGTYNSGRYIIARDLGINADVATYDYWKGKGK